MSEPTPPDAAAPDAPGPGPLAGRLPRIAIVGRPNVGKSTLFNALVQKRIAIEDPMAGVTRDRVSFVLEDEDAERAVELIDTGGIGQVDETLLKDEIDTQIAIALDLADLIVFLVDAKNDLSPLDREVADRLRRLDRPILLLANKVESRADELAGAALWSLGFGEPTCISAKERLGITDLRERLLDWFPEARQHVPVDDEDPDAVRLAIVGRMNVGKSTLVNAIAGDERVIVSDVAGTTRDSVDVPFLLDDRRFIAIDTAGMRKRKTIADSVEFYGQSRAERSLRRADVALLMLDATREVGRIDRQIGGIIVDRGIPCIVVVNKWDLARSTAMIPEFEDYIRNTIQHLAHAPIAFMSATEGLNVRGTLKLAAELHDQAGYRVGTGELNRLIQKAWEKQRPRPWRGRIGKVYYASQVGVHPPRIMLYVNDPDLFEDSWRRFLLHELQEHLPFQDIGMRLLFQRSGGRRDD